MKNNLNLMSCLLEKDKINFIKNNPHCLEYFIYNENIQNCTNCLNFLIKNDKFKFNSILEKNYKNEYYNNKKYYKNFNYCNNCFNKNTYLYPIIKKDWESNENDEIDNIKKKKNIKKILEYKINNLPIINSQTIFPKCLTVVHWGQLKMFLNTLQFLIKKNKEQIKEFNIIYPGSARGDNIILLSKMFPNTRWYLIDPAPFHKDLYNNNQIIEIRNEIFTDDIAKEYSLKLKNKFYVFISDIRFDNKNENIINDQINNINWFKITNAEFAWLKFRCPYDNKNYEYYDGDIYIQPYAKKDSSEGRLLLNKYLKKKNYDVNQYVGKFYYFNRILRPSYYTTFIENHELLDHCWDCACFQYIIKNYIKYFKNFNYFKSENIKYIVNYIINFISKNTVNKIKLSNELIKSRLY